MTRSKQKVLEYVVEGALIFLVLAVLALVSMGVYSVYDVIFN